MKKYLPLLFSTLFACCAVSAAVDPDKLSSKDFLELMRRPRGVETWGQMSGQIDHARSDGRKSSASIYLATLFAVDRMMSQVIVDNRQGYLIGQSFDGADSGTTVTPMHTVSAKAGKDLLGEFGLRAEDLTMSFIYWDFVKELPRETITFRTCRVFLLRKGDEYVRLFVNAQYLFPMKVSWYKGKFDEKEDPYRTLEATKFKEVNDLWLVTRLQLEGPGWRTRVDFTDAKAGYRATMPKDLFRSSLP